jgi:hypothetical protein
MEDIMKLRFLVLFTVFIGLASLGFAQYSYFENFEGLSFPPAGWTMSNVARVSATTTTIPAVVPTAPYTGVYCVGNSSAVGNFIMTPLLASPTQIVYHHKKGTGNYTFYVQWAYNTAGPWTTFPGYPLAAGNGWSTATINISGLENIYVRWVPELPPPNPLKYWYLDDVTIWLNEPTVPVELSSFTANLLQELDQEYFVQLHWTTQSETETSGFNVFRNSDNTLVNATQLNLAMIEATNTSMTTTYSFTDTEAEPGTWYYWLQSNSMGGVSEYFGPISITITPDHSEGVAPVNFFLNKVGPNPFNPAFSTLTGSFGLSKEEFVSINIYNMKGQKVRTLVNGTREAGYHREISWNGRDDNGRTCRSGMYYLTMTTGSYSTTRKIAIVK